MHRPGGDQPQCILVITGATPEGCRKAVDCPIKDRDALLAFYDVPVQHCCICERSTRGHICDGTAQDDPIEGLPVEQDRAGYGLQGGQGRSEMLATPPGLRPVAKSHPRFEVHRRTIIKL